MKKMKLLVVSMLMSVFVLALPNTVVASIPFTDAEFEYAETVWNVLLDTEEALLVFLEVMDAGNPTATLVAMAELQVQLNPLIPYVLHAPPVSPRFSDLNYHLEKAIMYSQNATISLNLAYRHVQDRFFVEWGRYFDGFVEHNLASRRAFILLMIDALGDEALEVLSPELLQWLEEVVPLQDRRYVENPAIPSFGQIVGLVPHDTNIYGEEVTFIYVADSLTVEVIESYLDFIRSEGWEIRELNPADIGMDPYVRAGNRNLPVVVMVAVQLDEEDNETVVEGFFMLVTFLFYDVPIFSITFDMVEVEAA